MYPKPLQRQNVPIVCQIFNDKTVAALSTLKDKLGISEGTIVLIKLITDWFHMINVKDRCSGKIRVMSIVNRGPRIAPRLTRIALSFKNSMKLMSYRLVHGQVDKVGHRNSQSRLKMHFTVYKSQCSSSRVVDTPQLQLCFAWCVRGCGSREVFWPSQTT